MKLPTRNGALLADFTKMAGLSEVSTNSWGVTPMLGLHVTLLRQWRKPSVLALCAQHAPWFNGIMDVGDFHNHPQIPFGSTLRQIFAELRSLVSSSGLIYTLAHVAFTDFFLDQVHDATVDEWCHRLSADKLALVSAFVAGSVDAQTPGPAAPADLVAYNPHTEGEIILYWDAVEDAVDCRVCRRMQAPPGRWGCLDSPDNSALLTRLEVGVVYDFVVAAHDGLFNSSWTCTEATVGIPEVDLDPITGLPIPDGYLSVGEPTTHLLGRMFTLTGITSEAAVTLGASDFPPMVGRRYVKACGTVTAPADSDVRFLPGSDNNLHTELGMGFQVVDDRVEDWSDVGVVPAGETRSACDV